MDSSTVAENGVVALTLLLCATPFLLVALVILALGPSRWPSFARTWWESLPAMARLILRRVQPVVWLLVGVFVGSALINPIALWLRSLMH